MTLGLFVRSAGKLAGQAEHSNWLHRALLRHRDRREGKCCGAEQSVQS